MGFVLIVKGPDGEVREIQLVEGDTSVGRDPASALVLEGRGVSRRHARVSLREGKLTITDLGSTYGTRVNNAVVTQSELADGDRIVVGMYHLTVKESTRSVGPRLEDLAKTLNDGVPDSFADEMTQPPPPSGGGDVHQRKTLQMNRDALNFVLDNPDEEGRAVKVLPRQDSSLMKAVKRLGTTDLKRAATETPQPRGTDYRALVLMYKVTELLAGANDVVGFADPMAELVLEEVEADTLVLLMREGDRDELLPQVIRHRGQLSAGEIPVSRSILDRVVRERVAVMSNDPSSDSRLAPGQSVMLYNIRAAMAFPLLVRDQVRGVLYLSRALARPFTAADGDLVAALSALVSSGIERAELKERVLREKQRRKSLERFHPPEVVDKLFTSDAEGPDGALDEHPATVLVCDLRGFHEQVAQVDHRQLATVLHEYYELLYEKVFANGGSLVKLHDGWALALFGTPHSQDRDAVWAVEAARMLCAEFDSMAALWPSPTPLSLRCALDTGTVIAGVVGPLDRQEYTAIGTPISTAAAIASRDQGTSVSLTERTWSELPRQRYRVEVLPPAGEVRVFRLQL